MTEKSNFEKLKIIYQLLFEMAIGKHIEPVEETICLSNEFDVFLNEIYTINKRLNKLVFDNNLVIPSYYPYRNITKMLFVLNEEYRLINFNSEVVRLLNYKSEELKGIVFEKLIHPISLSFWKNIKENNFNSSTLYTTVEIIFLTKNNDLLPKYCTVSGLTNEPFLILASITTNSENLFNSNKNVLKKEKLNTSFKDFTIIQKLHGYILEHLDEPLPTLKELAKLLGSEEHKLKVGFRKYYNTSVYHFYHEERLKKSHSLILHSSIPLKEISFLCGFNTYLNFYKAFKKQYGYLPSDLSRKEEF